MAAKLFGQIFRSEAFGADLRQATRQICKKPAFSLTVVRRFLLIMLAFFGAAALFLSTLGIYGLVSFIAASRTREVGIRIVLGATKANIGGLIVSDGLRLTLLGIGAGVMLSAAAGRLLSSLLFGVQSFDLETVALTIAVLGLASTIAALIPAWRSSRVHPTAALRTE